MTILVLLVYFLGQMLNHTSKAWTLGRARVERMQNARSISDFIGSELRMALLPIDRPNTNNLQFVVNPSQISSPSRNHDAMFWQTPLATDSVWGDVAQVGYFVRWDDSRPDNPRANLCRYFVNPATRSAQGAISSSPNFRIYSSPLLWLLESDLNDLCPADKANSYKGLFAENVLGFWVSCLDAYGKPITLDAGGSAYTDNAFDSRRGYKDSVGTIFSACSLPPSVDVSFAVLDTRSADKVGLTERNAIKQLVAISANAADFEKKVASASELKQIYPGLRCHQTRVYLQNSR